MKKIKNIIAGLIVLALPVPAFAASIHDSIGRKARINIPETVRKAEELNLMPDIYFEYNSTEVRPSNRKRLGEVVAYMKQHPYAAVILKGWTDNSGSEKTNEEYSQKRADNVKEILVSEGIESWRIFSIGMGQDCTDSCPDSSRRVEISLSPVR